ncbi:hypothetical protein FB107DRAFT_260043 [Schizophyllum commune]
MPDEGFSSPTASRRERRRTRRPPSANTPSRLPAPSTGLLSLLAAVASANGAHGSPTPPSFLCPGLGTDECATSSTAPITPHRKRSSSSKRKVDRKIPDKYEEGEDGVWRKVDYSLHGGGSCTSATSTYLDDDTKFSVSPTSSSTASATSSAASSADMAEASTHLLETLPNGWKPTARASSSRTTLILALSLALAICVCVFMIGCIFWRRGSRRKGREKDMEMKLRRRRRDPEEEEALAARQEAEVKQRTITRLISRWKANTRSSARYRRSRKVLRALHASSATAHSTPSDDEAPRSRSQSPSSLRTSTTSSRSSAIQSEGNSVVVEAQTTAVDLQPPPPLPSHQPDALALPPAYRRRTPPPSISTTSDEFDSGPSDVKSLVLSQDHAYTHESSNLAPPSPFGESSSHYSALHAAHVATDDKALLAQLARQASAPPATAQRAEPSSYSAPLWVDEEVENLADVMEPAGGRDSPDSYRAAGGSGSAFPDPPSKGQMAALMDSQDYEYHDVFLDAMPAPGPSAPPFDFGGELADAREGPSVLPSAPPLFEDVGEEGEVLTGPEASLRPSAPPLDDSEVPLTELAEATAPVGADEEDLEYAESDGEGKGPDVGGTDAGEAATDGGQGHDRQTTSVTGEDQPSGQHHG